MLHFVIVKVRQYCQSYTKVSSFSKKLSCYNLFGVLVIKFLVKSCEISQNTNIPYERLIVVTCYSKTYFGLKNDMCSFAWTRAHYYLAKLRGNKQLKR